MREPAKTPRQHWFAVANEMALSHCKCLNLVPYSARGLTRLPDDVGRAVLLTICQEAQNAALLEEQLQRRAPWMRARLNGNLWKQLARYGRRAGEADTGFLFRDYPLNFEATSDEVHHLETAG